MRSYLLSTTALRAPDDGNGAAVEQATVAASEALEAAHEAGEAADEAVQAAGEVAGLEAAAEHAEERAEVAEEAAGAILAATAEIEAKRGVDELWRELDGLRVKSVDLESRVETQATELTSLRETVARLEGLMVGLAASPSTEAVSTLTPQPSPPLLDPTNNPEVPEADLSESRPAEKARRKTRLI